MKTDKHATASRPILTEKIKEFNKLQVSDVDLYDMCLKGNFLLNKLLKIKYP